MGLKQHCTPRRQLKSMTYLRISPSSYCTRSQHWKLQNASSYGKCSKQSCYGRIQFSIIELASCVDLTPWHRFGFTAANAAILDVFEGYTAIHIVDLSMTHCMQIPTLVDAIANRHEVPLLLKFTVVTSIEDVPPILDLSYDDLGLNFYKT